MSRLLPFLIFLVAVAFFTEVGFFFHLAFALFGIYFLGRLWAQRSLGAVTIQRHHEKRIFLGETFQVQVEVLNQSWLPVLWMRLTDNIPSDLTSGIALRRVISLLPRERQTLSYTLHGRRRGYYRIGPLSTLGGDLLGSARVESHQAQDDYVVVYPRIVALRDLGLPSQSPFGTLPSRDRIFEDPSRIQGVRDYQPGDSLRKMNWKTSARVGSLQVRRYEPAISLETAIFLNLNGDDYPQRYRYPATELGVVVAASAAVHLVEKRQAVGFFSNGSDPFQSPPSEAGEPTPIPAHPPRKGRGHLLHLLDLLARVEVTSADKALPFLELLGRRSLGLSWGSTVIVVTACEVEGLLDTLLALRRRGLVVLLVLTCPDRDFALTAQRTSQIGIQTLRIWSEQHLDRWR
jgi:uncharacterized protein (DUF58 family)